MINIEIVYALPDKLWQHNLTLKLGTTLAGALAASTFYQDFPDMQDQELLVGIWGKRAHLQQILQNHDRIEIYRPLTIDPKQARVIKVMREKKKHAKK